jgi:hypothetical protein
MPSPLMRLMPRKLVLVPPAGYANTVSLERLVNLSWAEVAIVVERVKAFSKGSFAWGQK